MRQKSSDRFNAKDGDGPQCGWGDVKRNEQNMIWLSNRSGAALVMVLWVLTLLTVVSAEFCRTIRTETNISRNFRDSTQAYYAAVAGLNMSIYHIVQNAAFPKPPQEKNTDEENGPDPWRINTDNPRIDFGSVRFSVRIDNESGKININLADEGLLRLLFDGFDISDEEKSIIIDSILDWRDADQLHRLNGAESDYYQSLEEPYACKDGDFETVEELLKVRGITPEIFFGGLSHMVTVYPGRQLLEKNKAQSKGKATATAGFDYNHINLNAASPELLSILPGFTPDVVEAFTAARKEHDFLQNNELLEFIDVKALAMLKNWLTDDLSPFYLIRVRGNALDSETHREIGAVVRIDLNMDGQYQIVQWFDHIRPDDSGW